MTYTPRYMYWLDKAHVKQEELPPELSALVSQYDTTFRLWQKSPEKEQQPYQTMLEYTDAYISAKLFQLYETRATFSEEEDKLKDLLSKAADLDF